MHWVSSMPRKIPAGKQDSPPNEARGAGVPADQPPQPGNRHHELQGVGTGGVSEVMGHSSDSEEAFKDQSLGPAKQPIDWMIADLRGEERTLGWYVESAERGDRASALRALQLCVQSLSPTALKQNGFLMMPDLALALRRILGPAVETGDSAVLRAARGSPLVKTADPATTSISWWRCYEMHKLLRETPGLSQIKAAAQVLDGINGGQPSSLQKRYRALRTELEAYFREIERGDAEK